MIQHCELQKAEDEFLKISMECCKHEARELNKVADNQRRLTSVSADYAANEQMFTQTVDNCKENPIQVLKQFVERRSRHYRLVHCLKYCVFMDLMCFEFMSGDPADGLSRGNLTNFDFRVLVCTVKVYTIPNYPPLKTFAGCVYGNV